MTHYEVLGVASNASGAEVRRAYLSAARVAHPDTATGSEERMRELNAAFRVLSDTGRRADYDRSLGLRRGVAGAGGDDGPVIRRPDTTFVPHRAYSRVDDEPAELDDDGDPATATPLVAQVLPAALVVASLAVGSAGLATGKFPLVVMAVALAVIAAISFVVVPLLAMGRAAAAERRAELRRHEPRPEAGRGGGSARGSRR